MMLQYVLRLVFFLTFCPYYHLMFSMYFLDFLRQHITTQHPSQALLKKPRPGRAQFVDNRHVEWDSMSEFIHETVWESQEIVC